MVSIVNSLSVVFQDALAARHNCFIYKKLYTIYDGKIKRVRY